MQKSIICGLSSPDIDIKTYTPSIKDNFGFLLQIFVGIDGEPGDECFDVYVCTPKWIEQNYTKQTVLIGLYSIIVQEYNYERIIKAIEELFCIEGATWGMISCDLSYYGLSEMDFKHWNLHKNSVMCGVIQTSNHSAE